MSGALGGPTEYGRLNRLVGDSAGVRQQLDRLTQQAATGRVAETYSGLGVGARASLDLRPLIAHQDTWRSNIDTATGRMQVAQTAMTQVQKVATDLVAQLLELGVPGVHIYAMNKSNSIMEIYDKLGISE